MPNFPSVESAHEWCERSFPYVTPATPHHIHWLELGFWAAVIGAGIYALVRFVPVLWTDVKSVFGTAVAGVKAGATKVEAAV